MSKVSAETLAFTRTMTPRQWAVLAALVEGPYCLSVTEHCDMEILSLIEHGLAKVYRFETEADFETLPILYPGDLAEQVIKSRSPADRTISPALRGK